MRTAPVCVAIWGLDSLARVVASVSLSNKTYPAGYQSNDQNFHISLQLISEQIFDAISNINMKMAVIQKDLLFCRCLYRTFCMFLSPPSEIYANCWLENP